MRRIRPTEVKALVALLEADHDDVEELAREIVRTINLLRAGEEQWVRVVRDSHHRDGSGYVLYGTYPNATYARKDRSSVGSKVSVMDADIRLYRLIPPWGVAEEAEK